MTVKMIYKTEQGTTWTTMQEAMLADVIEQSHIYIESYRLKDLVEKITEKLVLSLKQEAITRDDCCVNYDKDYGDIS